MFPYQMYEAERTRSAKEQQEIDQINAEIVAAITSPFQSLAARLRSARRMTRPGTSRPRTPSSGCEAGQGDDAVTRGRARRLGAHYGGYRRLV